MYNITAMVVDAVLWHWVAVVAMAEGTAKQIIEGFGRDIQRLTSYFYANDGLLASTWAHRLHRSFDVLTDLFEQVGLCTNVVNTVSMACRPCRAIGGHSVEAYGLRITREELTYREIIHLLLRFPDSDADLVTGSLVIHRQFQHGASRGDPRETPIPRCTQDISDILPSVSTRYCMPSGRIPGQATSQSAIRI